MPISNAPLAAATEASRHHDDQALVDSIFSFREFDLMTHEL